MPPPACLTLHLLTAAPPLPSAVPLPPPPGGALAERDPYAMPSAAYSTHFALRWGEPSPLGGGDVGRLLDSLEASWALFVEDWDLPTPYGTDAYYLNVYIGDTGGPPSGGAYGYYTRDREGWPMLVLSPDMVADSATTVTTIPHELFHAMQDATGHFPDTRAQGWIWESTASWVEGVLYPDDPLAYVFLFGYAFQPQAPLDLYVPFSSGALEEYRAYGAGIFHRYLDEHRDARDVVLDVWRDPADPDDPLASLPLDDAFVDFAAHNAVWDYARPEVLTLWLEYYAEDASFGAQDGRVTVEVPAMGSGSGWATPPATTLPEPLGYNVLRWQAPPPGSAIAEVALPEGWAARVVRTSASGAVDYPPLGTVSVAEGDTLYLVVAALSAAQAGEGYRYRLAPLSADDTDSGGEGDAPRTCGCQGGTGRLSVGGWGLLGWVLLRRRRSGGLG